jgi:hypothetical protein
VEVKHKDGKTIIVVDGEAEVHKATDTLYIIEVKKIKKDLLERLLRIPYRDRYLEKLKLSEDERTQLKSLVERGLVNLKKKYGKTFLDFPDSVYRKLKNRESVNKEGVDYFITSNQEQLKKVNPNEYIVLPGFDGKYYGIRKARFNLLSKNVVKLNKPELSTDFVARKLGIPEEEAYIVLRILAEQGLYVEKRKGVFAPV